MAPLWMARMASLSLPLLEPSSAAILSMAAAPPHDPGLDRAPATPREPVAFGLRGEETKDGLETLDECGVERGEGWDCCCCAEEDCGLLPPGESGSSNMGVGDVGTLA